MLLFDEGENVLTFRIGDDESYGGEGAGHTCISRTAVPSKPVPTAPPIVASVPLQGFRRDGTLPSRPDLVSDACFQEARVGAVLG